MCQEIRISAELLNLWFRFLFLIIVNCVMIRNKGNTPISRVLRYGKDRVRCLRDRNYWQFLCRPFEEKAIHRDRFVRPSVCPSVRPSRKLNYNFAISYYFFNKLSNYIAYDNTVMMMPNSLGQYHI
jgi:hypothetical protein